MHYVSERLLLLICELEKLRQTAIEKMDFDAAMVLRDAKLECLKAARLKRNRPWEAATFKAFEETMDPFFAGWYLDLLHRVVA